MKTYYLTFTITPVLGERPHTFYLEAKAPDILTASHMADIYMLGWRNAGGDPIECNKVSLFPSRKPKS